MQCFYDLPSSQLSWERIRLPCRRYRFNSWVGKIPWRRERLPTPVFLGFPGGSAGKESACSAGDPSSIPGSGIFLGFPGGSDGKESTCNVGELGSIPGFGRSPGKGNSYPLQYSGLESSMDSIVYGVTKSRMSLSDFHFLGF